MGYTGTFKFALKEKIQFLKNQYLRFFLKGIGFEPDIYCPLDYDGLAAGGRDTQLDCAVEYIYSQND